MFFSIQRSLDLDAAKDEPFLDQMAFVRPHLACVEWVQWSASQRQKNAKSMEFYDILLSILFYCFSSGRFFWRNNDPKSLWLRPWSFFQVFAPTIREI